MQIDKSSLVTSFTGVQFAVLADVYVMDIKKMESIPELVRPRMLKAAQEHLKTTVMMEAKNMNLLELAFNIGPQV